MRTVFLLSLCTGVLLAQIGLPGQYPGQYPGRYPPGTGYPGGNGTGSPAPSRRSKNTQQKPDEALSRTYSGVVRKIDPAGTFDLELEDTRYLVIQTSSATTKTGDLKVGDGVDVVATENKDGPFQATSIKSNPEIAKTINANDELPDEPAAAEEQRTGPPPTIMVPRDQTDDADADVPKLKRGKPAERPSSPAPDDSSDAPKPTLARTAPVSQTNSKQDFVEKARQVAASFLEGLPNYVCQEVATRYVSETRVPSWNVIDVVTADMVYEEGKESYRNMTINGKPSRKPPEETGAWSTGEFGTILAALFNPGTRTRFKFVEDGSISHMPASIYDFSVERLRSAWNVHTPGQYILSAYKGSVWIDKQSAHTLRIEMQAKDVPQEFPLVSIETAVDYDYITLGTPEKFLLPVHAEILSCDRGSNECGRNVIEFRNYHKFTGESVIKFGDDQK